MKDLNDILKQAQEMQQKMQEQMEQNKEKQQQAEHVGESGAGLVKVILNGRYAAKSVQLDSSLLSEDKEVIEDLIAAAINNAVSKVDDSQHSSFADLGAGLNIPKDFKFPF